MKYKIIYKKKALKFIQKQPKNQQIRIIEAIERLPRGDIDRLIITIVNAGNRGQIYNRY